MSAVCSGLSEPPDADHVDKLTLGSRLRTVRRSMDLTQEDVADRMRSAGHDWSRTTVAKIEIGLRQLSAVDLGVLSQKLGFDPGWILRPMPALRCCACCHAEFRYQTGRALMGQSRSIGVKYCSKKCADRMAARASRQRKRAHTESPPTEGELS